ncbi:AGC family protein kinase [Trichomonas vaginalis G3]|uniref:AGC family protein kinase n=1 Tax=Trichomonas vaginalis (strain ATCC PRA-98 / G3) TaxID=412133 RepID=A2E987_TRIV3|nr:protein serine/threonine kinase protein [Trichomonas vaginalis G3]EAY10772.1 AGC family protein kinase [Trichomonas vaginalis G3]KAI5536090.1 protein serine/threonine kinase protein [Trichomonas vaginalis G3]|eukprot:XP_001322995.1 AGC family protein kinase [Trichomonas vaginalis G3]
MFDNPDTSLYEKRGWLRLVDEHNTEIGKRYVIFNDAELALYLDGTLSELDKKFMVTRQTKAELLEDRKESTIKVTIDEKTKPLYFISARNEDISCWMLAINSKKLDMPKLSMNDFRIISVIGRGYYGKVMLVQKKDSGELFAIKYIRKSRLNDDNGSSVIAERNILMKVRHPFIVNLCFAFQTETKVYLGLEYAAGGELFYHMDQVGTIPIDDARLYIAEIGLALQHLHSIGIVYRDLKPENILFDEKGHIKLTDFGLSKSLDTSESTTTFCGTCEYLAPEIVTQQPYSYKVDEWALGVLAFEMIFGQTPFADENKVYLFDKIVSEDPEFPFLCDFKVTNFILRLLTKDPEKRPSFAEVQDDPFFAGLDWDKVYKREYTPRFIPKVKDPLHPTNFDPEFTNEIPTDSLCAPGLGDIGNIPGFSFMESKLG